MKSAGKYLSMLLSTGFVLVTISTVRGQSQQQSAIDCSEERRMVVLGTPPEGGLPVSEEILRYTDFFRELRAWDGTAKQAEDKGDTGWAEHFRAMLEKRSGLTASEAAEVKKIAFKYLKDEQAWQQRYDEAGMKLRASAPPPKAGQKLVLPPELVPLQQEHLDLANRAIAQLVTALGSRSFSKLDLFTRHMYDQMSAGCSSQPMGTSPQR